MIRVDWENKALTIDWEGDNRSNNERLIAPERDMVIGSGSSRPSIYAVATSCHFFFSFDIFQFDSPQRKINLNQPEIEKTKTNNNNNNNNNQNGETTTTTATIKRWVFLPALLLRRIRCSRHRRGDPDRSIHATGHRLRSGWTGIWCAPKAAAGAREREKTVDEWNQCRGESSADIISDDGYSFLEPQPNPTETDSYVGRWDFLVRLSIEIFTGGWQCQMRAVGHHLDADKRSGKISPWIQKLDLTGEREIRPELQLKFRRKEKKNQHPIPSLNYPWYFIVINVEWYVNWMAVMCASSATEVIISGQSFKQFVTDFLSFFLSFFLSISACLSWK